MYDKDQKLRDSSIMKELIGHTRVGLIIEFDESNPDGATVGDLADWCGSRVAQWDVDSPEMAWAANDVRRRLGAPCILFQARITRGPNMAATAVGRTIDSAMKRLLDRDNTAGWLIVRDADTIPTPKDWPSARWFAYANRGDAERDSLNGVNVSHYAVITLTEVSQGFADSVEQLSDVKNIEATTGAQKIVEAGTQEMRDTADGIVGMLVNGIAIVEVADKVERLTDGMSPAQLLALTVLLFDSAIRHTCEVRDLVQALDAELVRRPAFSKRTEEALRWWAANVAQVGPS